jgi:phosphate transport system permease protein
MTPLMWIALVLLLTACAYRAGVLRIKRMVVDSTKPLHSLPHFHGLYCALWTVVPMLIWSAVVAFFAPMLIKSIVLSEAGTGYLNSLSGGVSFLWSSIQEQAFGEKSIYGAIEQPMQKLVSHYEILMTWKMRIWAGISLLLIISGLLESMNGLHPQFPARKLLEAYAKTVLILCALTSVLITLAIMLSVLFESIRFFGMVPIENFLFGMQWSPQMAIRADQAGSSGSFGMIPLFAGTLLITLIAMAVALPIGLLSAIYMTEYASRKLRSTLKPMLEILAGIPTVVYGYFAIITLSPLLRGMGQSMGLDVSSESALCAGIVMGIMIIPFVSSLSDDIITAVPQNLRDASLALGATQSETIKLVVFPAALPGIMGAVLLAISRAVGETMIVVMAAGLAANLTANPLEAVTTVTAQIVSLLVGDQEFNSPKTLAAFALGLTLFITTLVLNIIALVIVKKYREKYE